MTEFEGSIYTDFTVVHLIYRDEDVITCHCAKKIAVRSCAFPVI